MDDQYFVELEYQNFLAKEELLDKLTEISECYRLPLLTEGHIEILDEMTFQTISVYVTKVMNNIQKAWNNFKTGYQDSTWASYKSVNSKYFTSTFEMKTPENGIEDPDLDEINKFVTGYRMPKWDDDGDNLRKFSSKESFLTYGCQAGFLFDKDKTVFEVAEAKYFKEIKNSIIINGNGLTKYVKFMDTYSDKYDKVAEDIRNINLSSKEVTAAAHEMKRAKEKAEEEKKRAEEKAKEEAEKANEKAEQEAKEKEEKAKEDASKPTTTTSSSTSAPEVTTDAYVFNTAEFFLETFLLTEEEGKEGGGSFKAAEGPVTRKVGSGSKMVKSEDKADSEESTDDKEFQAKLDSINTYFSAASEFLSAKLKCLDRARKTSFKIIQNYCKLASKQAKADKKEAKNKAKEGESNAEENTDSKNKTAVEI